MTPRPGQIAAIIDIDLPRPRTDATRTLPRFFDLVTTVRATLRDGVRL